MNDSKRHTDFSAFVALLLMNFLWSGAMLSSAALFAMTFHPAFAILCGSCLYLLVMENFW